MQGSSVHRYRPSAAPSGRSCRVRREATARQWYPVRSSPAGARSRFGCGPIHGAHGDPPHGSFAGGEAPGVAGGRTGCGGAGRLTRAAAGARTGRGRWERWPATSWRRPTAGRGPVDGPCARRWPAPVGCRRRGGCEVAAAHLAGDDGGPDGLFGAPVGGVDRRVPQEQKHGRESVAKCPAKRLASSNRGGGVDLATEPLASSRPRADARLCGLSAPAWQRPRKSRPAWRTACTFAAQGLRGWSSWSCVQRRSRCARHALGAAPGNRDTPPTRRAPTRRRTRLRGPSPPRRTRGRDESRRRSSSEAPPQTDQTCGPRSMPRWSRTPAAAPSAA